MSTQGCWESHYLISTQSVCMDISPSVDMNNVEQDLSDIEHRDSHNEMDMKSSSSGL